MPDAELNLLHVHSKSIGYGQMGVAWAEQLEAMGIDVYDDLPSPDPSDALRRANERHGQDIRKSKACHTAMWASVPTHARGWWKGQRPVIATMWEATRLPPSFRENLHEFDLVIVPSEQNLELFSQFHSDVVKVPLGVDPDRWAFRARQEPGRYFTFLIGGSGARKGTDLAYAAFRRLWGRDGSWGDGPIPQLVFKSPKNEPYVGERIERIGGRISDEEEVELYASAQCYIQPSRGEGFGLQPLQAIAQGCPTILTDAHGQAEYARHAIPIGYTMKKADYFIYGDAGDWWEPSLDDLCDRMLWVYNNYEQAVSNAVIASAFVRKNLSWRRSAEKLVDALGWDSLVAAPPVQDEWYQPEAKRFLVITNQMWLADIAGISYQFNPGQEYWEPADVKRILFESGKLDPACLEVDDSGLLPSQLERLGAYSAAHSYCHACGQQLGTRPTRTDALLAAAGG